LIGHQSDNVDKGHNLVHIMRIRNISCYISSFFILPMRDYVQLVFRRIVFAILSNIAFYTKTYYSLIGGMRLGR
jgi:hypothetical protein